MLSGEGNANRVQVTAAARFSPGRSQAQRSGRAWLGGFVLDLGSARIFLTVLNPFPGSHSFDWSLPVHMLFPMVAKESFIVSNPGPSSEENLVRFQPSLPIMKIIVFLFTRWLEIYKCAFLSSSLPPPRSPAPPMVEKCFVTAEASGCWYKSASENENSNIRLGTKRIVKIPMKGQATQLTRGRAETELRPPEPWPYIFARIL